MGIEADGAEVVACFEGQHACVVQDLLPIRTIFELQYILENTQDLCPDFVTFSFQHLSLYKFGVVDKEVEHVSLLDLKLPIFLFGTL